jgi:predicted O-methyltransferase YrrM
VSRLVRRVDDRLARCLGGALAPGLPRSLVELAADRFDASPLRLASDRARHGRLGWYIWQSRRVLGWTRGAEAVALIRQAYALPASPTIVEVGAFLGCSTILLAGARKLRGSGRVHAVDPFDASGDAYSVPYYLAIAGRGRATLRARFEANLRRAGVADRVELHQGRAEVVAAGWSAPIDLLFLDGDQSPAGAQAGYLAWARHLRSGAVIAVHNSVATEPEHDGSRRLVEELIRPPDYRDLRLVDSITFARRV